MKTIILRFFIPNFVKTGIVSIFVWMNNIELINCCLLGAVIGISTLCGLVLHQGGFVANNTDGGRDEEVGKTSLLQKSFGVWTFFIATLFVGYFILYLKSATKFDNANFA